MRQKRVICVFTGNGKGKTSAGLGMVFRATGHGQRCGVIQFIKSNPAKLGEYKMAKTLGIPWENFGHGFTWKQKHLDESIADAKAGWERIKELIDSGKYDLLLLDEISYVISYGWLDAEEIVTWFKKHHEILPTLVLTGRAMPKAIIDYADMVSDIQEIKHHFSTQGIPAQKGIEF